MQMYAVPAVPPEYDLLSMTWPRVEQMLASAISPSDGTMDEVLQCIKDQSAQLWVAVDGDTVRAACVTYLMGGCCHIWICAGSQRQDWMKYLECIKEWARHHECDRISLRGRKGWARIFRHWKIVSIELECRIDG